MKQLNEQPTINAANKFSATLDSRNFFVSLVSVILLAFEANNLAIDADPGSIVDVVTGGDIGRIVSIFFLNFFNPIMKLINKTASWSWAFLKSPNFWTQIVTALLIGISGFGLIFPESAAADLVNAIFGGEFQSIALAIVLNVLNPLYHFFFDRDKEPSPASG